MEILKSMIGGLVEGLTAALPLSESAHRLLFEKLAKEAIPAGLGLAVVFATILVFHKTVWECIKSLGKMAAAMKAGKFRWRKASRYQKMALYALLAAVPYWILIFLQKQFGFLGGIGQNLLLAGCLLLANAGLLFIGDHSVEKRWDLTDLSGGQAIKLGLFQAVSILPGFSRTGMTLCMARNMGFDKTAAMEFSFMTAIPAILGAELISAKATLASIGNIGGYAIAFAAALVGAIGGALLVKKMIQKENLYLLMFYSAAIGIAAMVLNFVKI